MTVRVDGMSVAVMLTPVRADEMNAVVMLTTVKTDAMHADVTRMKRGGITAIEGLKRAETIHDE